MGRGDSQDARGAECPRVLQIAWVRVSQYPDESPAGPFPFAMLVDAFTSQAPEVITPSGSQKIEGDISIPSSKFFTLEAPPLNQSAWQQVWQNMDMQLYAKSVPFAVQPFVVRLDAKSKAGGFVRNWPPPGERVSMHLGYAYQWFGFALTLLIIFIVLNVKKKI